MENFRKTKKHINTIGGAFCVNIAFMLFFALFYGKFAADLNLSQDAAFILTVVLNAALNYVLPLIILGITFRRNKYENVHINHINRKKPPFLIISAFCLAYLAAFVGGIIGGLIQVATSSPAPFSDMPDLSQSIPRALAFYALVIIIAPVCEELIFRKFILVPLRKLGDVYAVVISALLFGLFHMNFIQFPYAFLGGLVLGYVAIWTNGIIIPIIIHMLLNGFEVLRVETAGIYIDIFFYIIIFAGIFVLAYFIKRGYFKQFPQSEQAETSPKIPLAAKLKLTFTNPLMFICLLLFVFFGFIM